MSGIKKMIDDLNQKYREVSETNMMYLCGRAEVQYRPFSEVKELLNSLKAKGFIIRMSKYNRPDRVGQFLVLRTIGGEFVSGYEVWIEFENYTVKEREITEADIPANEVH